jgi:hypothetical protein
MFPKWGIIENRICDLLRVNGKPNVVGTAVKTDIEKAKTLVQV